jgi:uncharacterized iron-regulated membrane protein
MRFRRFIRQAHRWLGLLIGVQVLLWISGGVIMSVLRLDEVRGEHRAAKPAAVVLEPGAAFVPIGTVLQRGGLGAVTAVTLDSLLGRPVYRVQGKAGPVLVDALTGARLSPLPEATARALALADYAGPGTLVAVERVDTPALEYRGHELPLWRARFDDDHDTTLYISPQTGRVVARRNDLWRVFDFVWMLHIMDYEEREDFNHPLLIAAAITALLFTLTGLTMLGYSFWPRRAGA